MSKLPFSALVSSLEITELTKTTEPRRLLGSHFKDVILFACVTFYAECSSENAVRQFLYACNAVLVLVFRPEDKLLHVTLAECVYPCIVGDECRF